MDIIKVLQYKYPTAEWSIHGDDYDSIEWFSKGEKPTLEELEAAWPGVEKAIDDESVKIARLNAYRNTADPLFFQWQAGEATEAEWLAARAAVVEAFPYGN